MGRTWPNLDAETVTEPGYYWNERLKKLARLSAGEKLPRHVGAWELVAREGEGSSSEITRRIFDRYPGMSVNEFTYTTTSPLNRRLPIGDMPPGRKWLALAGLALGTLALGFVVGELLARRSAPRMASTEKRRVKRIKPSEAHLVLERRAPWREKLLGWRGHEPTASFRIDD